MSIAIFSISLLTSNIIFFNIVSFPCSLLLALCYNLTYISSDSYLLYMYSFKHLVSAPPPTFLQWNDKKRKNKREEIEEKNNTITPFIDRNSSSPTLTFLALPLHLHKIHKLFLSFSGSESGDTLDFDHFDFNLVTQALPFLRELRITYGY